MTMWEYGILKDPSSVIRHPLTVNRQPSTVNRQPNETAGNYSSPAAEDIGWTKICKSNKGSGS
jgi:hypothetical protein